MGGHGPFRGLEAPLALVLSLRATGEACNWCARPFPASNVFIRETLEGALSDANGRFLVRTSHRGPATVVRHLGFRFVQLLVTVPRTEPLSITMTREATRLAAVTVQAGRDTAGDERGATLTTLEVVTTPGAAANVNRAIQTLPGTQAVNLDHVSALIPFDGSRLQVEMRDGMKVMASRTRSGELRHLAT